MNVGSKVRARLDASISGEVDAVTDDERGMLLRVCDKWFSPEYLVCTKT